MPNACNATAKIAESQILGTKEKENVLYYYTELGACITE